MAVAQAGKAVLTGRYRLEPSVFGGVKIIVEEHGDKGFVWRHATRADIPELEPMVADGWRFPEERSGVLGHDGKRHHV
jgi:hypothetical protein